MPSQLQTLSNHLVLKVYNSTSRVVNGCGAGPQRPQVHPVCISCRHEPLTDPRRTLVTGVSAIPLRYRDFWYKLVDSAHQSAPSLGNRRFLDFFVFENVYDGLAEVPDSLRSLRVRHLSLCANGLKTLPERLFWANSTIEILDLSSNPLMTLPKRSDVTDSPSTPLWELHVEFSGIKTLPEWLHTVSSSFYSLEARHYVKTLDLWRSC
ncbi:TPA: hypothetical protein N0F65_011984 [Lagenidium giganteum]|uniref:Uncharacterized protein n=1 Tax=Lagenidium giganteum TaxID=4803 RepID=A0AAV2ZAF9_9STRA|nr:TPA: hypothetical protein N0F65_011984 [Lagenidium giganteum]